MLRRFALSEVGRISSTNSAMTSRLNFVVLCALGALFSSCAPYQLPEGYTGPTASIRSTGKSVNSVKAEGYYILEVNGKFANHSPMGTARGAGMGVVIKEQTLQVPSEPLNLTLSGGNIYAADGVAMADSMIGGNHQVSGDVSFTPKPNGDYSVTGVTGKERCAVWIVDNKTGKVVSSLVE